MKESTMKALVAAVTVTLGLGVASNAHASAYAESINVLVDGFINPLISPATIGFGTPNNTSGASATHTNLGSAIAPADVGTGLRDIPNQTVGVGPGENSWVVYGQQGFDYASGDSELSQEQTLPGTTPGTGIQAANAARAEVFYSGSGSATGNVSSGTTVQVPFQVNVPDAIGFNFTFDPYLAVDLDQPDAKPGSSAIATLAASITIRDLLGNLIFNWAPDGIAGGITGGIELLDPYSLQTNVQVIDPLAGPLVVDNPQGTFVAQTNILAAGNYILSLAMAENVSVVRVPEPASLALMGLGLAAMGGFVGRRRKKV